MSPDSAIFELSVEQVIPALRRAVGSGDVADVSLSHVDELSMEARGYCARGLIATFTGHTEGRQWEKTLFVKRLHWADYHEASHYERLERYGIPVIQCYGFVPGNEGVEILFLEYLSHVGIDVADASQVRSLIGLHAGLNALGVPHAYEADVRVPDVSLLITKWTEAIDDLLRQGTAGHLGSELSIICRAHSREELLAKVEATAIAVSSMPQALNHGEAGPANCGWRDGGLVLFDMHRVGPAPRFFDIAVILNGVSAGSIPALSSKDAVSFYLEEYRRLGSVPVTDSQFIRDIEALQLYNAYNLLPWLTHGSRDSAAEGPKGRGDQRASLQRTIPCLLRG